MGNDPGDLYLSGGASIGPKAPTRGDVIRRSTFITIGCYAVLSGDVGLLPPSPTPLRHSMLDSEHELSEVRAVRSADACLCLPCDGENRVAAGSDYDRDDFGHGEHYDEAH